MAPDPKENGGALGEHMDHDTAAVPPNNKKDALKASNKKKKDEKKKDDDLVSGHACEQSVNPIVLGLGNRLLSSLGLWVPWVLSMLDWRLVAGARMGRAGFVT